MQQDYIHLISEGLQPIQSYCLNEYQKSTAYIPNGVAPAKPQNCSLIDQWDIVPGKYLLMISRLVKHKGAHYLLEAWQLARQQNPELLKDCKLVIVGDSTFTNNYVAQLRQIARGDNSIIFTGWQKGQTLAELYANSALLVHPSENEGLPITVLQAMSHARPVLVSDIAEHKEVISDERFWFSNTSIHSLAQKIIELIQNPELLKEKGAKNKALVEKNYNWKDLTSQTIALYSSPKTGALKKLKTIEA